MGTISAKAGIAGGNGGVISIANQGTGELELSTVSISSAASHGIGGSITLSAQNGSLQLNAPLSGKNISLTAASGTLGSTGNPLLVDNGGAGLNLFVAGDSVNIRDSASEVVTLANTADLALSGKTSLTLSTNGNIIASNDVGTAISSPIVSLTSIGGSIGSNAALNTEVNGTLIFSAQGTVNIANTGNVTVGASTASNITLSSTESITADGGITTSGAIVVGTPTFNTAKGTTVSGSSITVNGPDGAALNISNAGTMIANAGDISVVSAKDNDLVISGGGLMSAVAGGITLTASNSDLPSKVLFTGSQTFTGPTVINAEGSLQSMVAQTGVVVLGNNSLTLNTDYLDKQGTAIVIGNPLIFGGRGFGTIANSSGSIDLKDIANLQFNGRTLAILAAGNIVNTGTSTTIDLSSVDRNGGSLNLIAGYNFSPSASVASTTPPVATPFLISGPSSNPASISLGNVTINTSASGAGNRAGNILAVATGSVTLGNIIATADSVAGTGGSVNVIGSGITVAGTVNTSASLSGSVTLNSAAPAIVGGAITVQKGLVKGGNFSSGAFSGDIAINFGINAGNGTITLVTDGSGAITQRYGAELRAALLSVTAGSKDFDLNTAATNLVLVSSTASASISSSVFLNLNSSAVGGNLSVTSSNGLNVNEGQVIKAGGNVALANTGASSNVSFGDNSVLSAGQLTSSGILKVAASPLLGMLSSDIQKSGSISIQSYGAVGLNTIEIGSNVQLSANGGDISFSSIKQNSNMSSLDQLNMSANGGSISIYNFSGNVNLGLAGGLGTTLTARTLNTYSGGNLNIIGSNGILIGGGACVNSQGSMFLNAYQGRVDIAPGSGGVINVGANTNIISSNGLSLGSSTSLNSANSINMLVFGQNSQIALGDNVTIRAGALNTGASQISSDILSSSDLKSSGNLFLTAIGSGGISGGANDAILTEGGGIYISAVGNGANASFGSGASLRADGAGINILTLGSFNLGSAGSGAAGSIVTRSIGQIGGSLVITAFNGLNIGDNTQNVIAGSLFLTNLGIGGNGSLAFGANSSTQVSGFVLLNQLGQNSSLIFGDNAVLQSTGFINALSLGPSSAASGSYSFDIRNNVRLESTGAGINLLALSAGELLVAGGSQILADNGGLNVFTSSSVDFGFGNSATLKAAGNLGYINITAADAVFFGHDSQVSAGKSINIFSGPLIAQYGTNIQAGTSGSGGINVFCSGANFGEYDVQTHINGTPTGATLATAGPEGYLRIFSFGFIEFAPETVVNTSRGISLSALTGGPNIAIYGSINFGDGAKVTSGADISLFTFNGFIPNFNASESTLRGVLTGSNVHIEASDGIDIKQFTVGGPITVGQSLLVGKTEFGTGTQLVSKNGNINIFSIGAINLDNGTNLNSGGSVSLTNLWQGQILFADNVSVIAGHDVNLTSFNPIGDVKIGDFVTLTAGFLQPNVPVLPYTTPLQFGDVRQAGSINITTYGSSPNPMAIVYEGTAIYIGKGANISSNGADVVLKSNSTYGAIQILDQFHIAANGGNVSISNAQGVLLIGVQDYGDSSSNITAQALGSSAGRIQVLSNYIMRLGVGNWQAGSSISVGATGAGIVMLGANMSAFTDLSLGNGHNSYVGFGMPSILQAGALVDGAPSSGNLTPDQIKSHGNLTISAYGVDFADHSGLGENGQLVIGGKSTLIANGGDLKVIATDVGVNSGAGNSFSANGGNVQILSAFKIVAGPENSFHARSVGNPTQPTTSVGGGIELFAGQAYSSNLIPALNSAPGSNPPAGLLGTGVTFTGNAGGVIQATASGTDPVNLNASGSNPSTLNLNGGVQLFEVNGINNGIMIDHASFSTESLRPIAMLTAIELDQASLARLPVSIERQGLTSKVVVGLHGAELHVLQTPDGNKAIVSAEKSKELDAKPQAQIYASQSTKFVYSPQGLSLTQGEVFLNASAKISVQTHLAEVHAQKGALASVKTEDGSIYVRVCSASGTVSVIVNGKTIMLNSGEELVVSDHKQDYSEIHPSDGLGRRNSHTLAYGSKHVTISDFSIISMVSNQETLFKLHRAENSNEKHLLDRLLKIAATVDVVLKYRGPYSTK